MVQISAILLLVRGVQATTCAPLPDTDLKAKVLAVRGTPGGFGECCNYCCGEEHHPAFTFYGSQCSSPNRCVCTTDDETHSVGYKGVTSGRCPSKFVEDAVSVGMGKFAEQLEVFPALSEMLHNEKCDCNTDDIKYGCRTELREAGCGDYGTGYGFCFDCQDCVPPKFACPSKPPGLFEAVPAVLPADAHSSDSISSGARDSTVQSCSDLCQSGGHGSGAVIGTAPACGASCDDCNGNACLAIQKGSVSDYGEGCITGKKVCCCSKTLPFLEAVPAGPADAHSSDSSSSSVQDSTVQSCSDLCQSGGHGSGSVIGTAPACGASCSDCNGNACLAIQKGSVSDYGEGCITGKKVCCCAKTLALV